MILSFFLLLSWVLALPFGLWVVGTIKAPGGDVSNWKAVFNILLFLVPMLAGGSATTWRLLAPKSEEKVTGRSVLFGMVAAAIVAVLYLAPQAKLEPDSNLLVWSIVYGFLGGLTSEAVMRKLQERDPLHANAAHPKAGPPAGRSHGRPHEA